MYYSPPYEPGAFESRAFVRLQDITLSYDLAKAITNRYGLNGVQLYVSGKNIYTWTKWSGWDPEISGDTPMMRSIIGGIKVSF